MRADNPLGIGVLLQVEGRLMRHETPDPEVREIATCRAGFAAASQFAYSRHRKIARRLALTDEKMGIPACSGPPGVRDRGHAGRRVRWGASACQVRSDA